MLVKTNTHTAESLDANPYKLGASNVPIGVTMYVFAEALKEAMLEVAEVATHLRMAPVPIVYIWKKQMEDFRGPWPGDMKFALADKDTCAIAWMALESRTRKREKYKVLPLAGRDVEVYALSGPAKVIADNLNMPSEQGGAGSSGATDVRLQVHDTITGDKETETVPMTTRIRDLRLVDKCVAEGVQFYVHVTAAGSTDFRPIQFTMLEAGLSAGQVVCGGRAQLTPNFKCDSHPCYS